MKMEYTNVAPYCLREILASSVALCYHQNGDILIEYWNTLARRCRAIFDQMDLSS